MELPEGWKIVSLGDEKIFKRYGGSTPSKSQSEYWNNGVIPWLSNTELKDNEINFVSSTCEKITQKGLDNCSASLLPKNCVLLTCTASIGKVGINEIELATNQQFNSFQCSEEVLPKYLAFFLLTQKNNLTKLGGSTSFCHINTKNLGTLKIPLPPLPVQRHIVAVLEQAEAVKRQRREADALTAALLQSMFLEMFGDPVRNERGWEKKDLKKFGEIKTGNTPPRINPSNYGDFTEWIKSDNINSQSMYLEKSQEFLSEEGLKIGRLAPKKSILITCIAGSLSCIGNAAIADRDVTFNQQINAILPKSDVSELFLYYAILMSQEYIQNHATKSMTKMINKGVLSELQFICPPLVLQQQFARVVQDVERIREQQVASGRQIEGLCEGLMQRAFDGELSIGKTL